MIQPSGARFLPSVVPTSTSTAEPRGFVGRDTSSPAPAELTRSPRPQQAVGYVEMADIQGAANALLLNGTIICGQPVIMYYKTSRSSYGQ